MKEVIVFTKVPERGQVKTRLQKRYSPYQVEEIYIAFLEDTIDKLRDYYPWIAYYPEGKAQVMWNLFGDRKYMLQRGRDMGEKLLNVFTDFYKMGVKDLLVVGCDVPTLRKEHIDDAFDLMDVNDLVLGPCHDGGFYLIGGGGARKELFEGVDWNGTDIFDKTKANAEALGLKVAILPNLRDVDHPEDIDALWSSGELDNGSRTYMVLKKMR